MTYSANRSFPLRIRRALHGYQSLTFHILRIPSGGSLPRVYLIAFKLFQWAEASVRTHND